MKFKIEITEENKLVETIEFDNLIEASKMFETTTSNLDGKNIVGEDGTLLLLFIEAEPEPKNMCDFKDISVALSVVK